MASSFSLFQIRKMVIANEPKKCSFNDCLHLGEPGCIVKGDWERYPFYFQLLDEIRVREEFQLRTFGTKREGDIRYGKIPGFVDVLFCKNKLSEHYICVFSYYGNEGAQLC